MKSPARGGPGGEFFRNNLNFKKSKHVVLI